MVDTPAAWKEAPAATSDARPLPAAWWRVFEDQELDAIEVQVVSANQDLHRAMARVFEARALAQLTVADQYPSITWANEATRQRTSANVPARGERQFTTYRAGFDLSYEIDLWGRNRNATNAATAEAFAEENDFYATLLALTADAARDYHELRALDGEIHVINATIALRRDALALQTTRHQAGLINEVDVTRARAELADAEAELHAAIRQRTRLEHALAVLSGQSPATFSVTPRAEVLALPEIPAGLPSELLTRRPDIRVASQRMEAARFSIATAKADFFPRISLTGSAGIASTELKTLTRGSSGIWSFGPNVYLPLFDGGRNRANLTAAEARYEQSTAAYRGSILSAFREVEDALSDLSTLAQEADAVARKRDAAQTTAKLTYERYERGLTNYLDVADAHRDLFRAQRDEAKVRGQQAIATALLAKAVGGGWSHAEVR